MWHEARRREKATQKLFSDHRKRAEKRREENRVDPSSLLQVHGIKSKIHLDLNTHKQAAKSLVVWQGDKKTTIDRFDVRATLSSLPKDDRALHTLKESAGKEQKARSTVVDADESHAMRRLLNFERYRLLVQNDLNKVPEGTRLKLVGKSEFLTEAKMKKLENNWFGTSGETSMPQTAQNSQRQSHSQSQQPRSQGVSVGFDYTHVPPPSSLTVQSDYATDAPKESLLKNVIDLDEFDKFDLDGVEKSTKGSKRTEEVTSKYGLSCDDFQLLVESDNSCTSVKDVLHRLQRLRDKKVGSAREQAPVDPTFYGPALPPEMLKSANDNALDDEGSSVNSSPIQQRSPSGGSIPLRCEGVTEDSKDTKPDIENSADVNEKLRQGTPHEDIPKPIGMDSSQTIETNGKTGTFGEVQSMARNVERPPVELALQDGQKNSDDNVGNSRQSRRAATPLAYKRYRRSSRSLSRERRSSSGNKKRQQEHSRSSRYCFRSCSRTSSSTESTGSDSSNSSDDSLSHLSASSRASTRSGRDHRSESPKSRRHRSRTSSTSRHNRESHRKYTPPKHHRRDYRKSRSRPHSRRRRR